jgi:mediator of RNA polymerase II transcription subunit 13
MCSNGKSSRGFLVAGVPSCVTQSSGCKLRGHSCYAEVSLDFPCMEAEKMLQENSNSQIKIAKHDVAEKISSGMIGKGEQKQGSSDHVSFLEKVFIYPAEALLVPVPQTMLARSSLRRHASYSLLLLIRVSLKNC